MAVKILSSVLLALKVGKIAVMALLLIPQIEMIRAANVEGALLPKQIKMRITVVRKVRSSSL